MHVSRTLIQCHCPYFLFSSDISSFLMHSLRLDLALVRFHNSLRSVITLIVNDKRITTALQNRRKMSRYALHIAGKDSFSRNKTKKTLATTNIHYIFLLCLYLPHYQLHDYNRLCSIWWMTNLLFFRQIGKLRKWWFAMSEQRTLERE